MGILPLRVFPSTGRPPVPQFPAKTPSVASAARNADLSIMARLPGMLFESRRMPASAKLGLHLPGPPSRDFHAFALKSEVFIDDRRGKPAHMTVFYLYFP
jgi:hypothetical protein